MAINVRCPSCGAAITLPDSLAGRKCFCPSCKSFIQAPVTWAAAAAPKPPSAPPPPAASAPLPAAPIPVAGQRQPAGVAVLPVPAAPRGPDKPPVAVHAAAAKTATEPETRGPTAEPPVKAEAGTLAAVLLVLIKAAFPSVAVHAAVLGVLGAVTFVVRAQPQKNQEVPMDIVLREEGEDAGRVSYLDRGVVVLESAEAPATAARPAGGEVSEAPQLMPGGGATGNEKNDGVGVGLSGLGTGKGGGSGEGTGGGFTVGAGSGVDGGILGAHARGNKFVYVVDRSGSMDGAKFGAARDGPEGLFWRLRKLTKRQSYHVIFFSSGTDEEGPGSGLVKGMPENLAKAEVWALGIHPRGGTEPEKALRRALELQPDVIIFMTDGLFDERVVDWITKANQELAEKREGRLVAIHTISYLDRSGEELLMRLSKQNRGTYTFFPGSGGAAPAQPPPP